MKYGKLIYLFFAIFMISLVGCSNTQNSITGDVVADNQDKELENQALPTEADFVLDTANSKLNWEAYKIIGGHKGTVDIKSGSLYRANNEFVAGEYVLDMTTIKDDDGSERLEDHLKNEDFFDVENHAESKFTIKKIIDDGDSMYSVIGDLEILGEEHEIMFPAAAVYNEGILAVKAEFDIDRTKWGINFRSSSVFKDIGDKAIKDEITYGLELVFKEQ